MRKEQKSREGESGWMRCVLYTRVDSMAGGGGFVSSPLVSFFVLRKCVHMRAFAPKVNPASQTAARTRFTRRV